MNLSKGKGLEPNKAGFQSPNYTQTPNDLFDALLVNMGEAELRVVLVLIRHTFGFHRSTARLGISEISKLAGLSYNGVLAGSRAAEERGLIRRINPSAIHKAEWELIVDVKPPQKNKAKSKHPQSMRGLSEDPQPVRGKPSPSEGQVGLNKQINKTPYRESDLQGLNHRSMKTIPELKRFEEATGFFPPPSLYWPIYKAIYSHNYSIDHIRKTYSAWCARGYNPRGLGWLLGDETYQNWMENIPSKNGGKSTSKSKGKENFNQPKLSPSELTKQREQARKDLVQK